MYVDATWSVQAVAWVPKGSLPPLEPFAPARSFDGHVFRCPLEECSPAILHKHPDLVLAFREIMKIAPFLHDHPRRSYTRLKTSDSILDI